MAFLSVTTLLGCPVVARAEQLVPARANVAVGAGDTAAVAWVRSDLKSVGQRVMVSVRRPGGAFGSPELVAAEPQDGLTRVSRPSFVPSVVGPVRVFVDRAGDALVVWQRLLGSDRTIETRQTWARWRHANGRWDPAAPVARPLQYTAEIAMAMAPSGHVFAAYHEDGSATTLLRTAVPGQRFGAAVRVPGVLFDVGLAATTDGSALLVGQGTDRAARLVLVRRSPGGAFTPGARLLTATGDVTGGVRDLPLVTGAADGAAVVAWMQEAGTTRSLQLARVPAGAGTAQVGSVSAVSQTAQLAALGATGSAVTIVVSQQPRSFALTSRSGGPFTAHDFSAAGVTAATGGDAALALWNPPAGNALTGSIRPAGEEFAALPPLTDPGRASITAAAAIGSDTALAAWIDGAGGASGLAASQPRLTVADVLVNGTPRTTLDQLVDVVTPKRPVLFDVRRGAQLTIARRLKVRAICRQPLTCAARLRVVRGSDARGVRLAATSARIRPGHERALALRIGPSTITAIRRGRLTRATVVLDATTGTSHWRSTAPIAFISY